MADKLQQAFRHHLPPAARRGRLISGTQRGFHAYQALLCASEFADLPGEDETFMALDDDEIVALVTSDDAPDLVDEVDTDEQVHSKYSITKCVHALEQVQRTQSANGAITAEFEDKLTDVIDEQPAQAIQHYTVRDPRLKCKLCSRLWWAPRPTDGSMQLLFVHMSYQL